jgi:small-conductance mechanosensitive channel
MLPATGTTPAAPREAASALVSELRGIDWLHLLEAWGLRLLAAVAIFVAGRWLAQRLGNGLDRVMARAGVDPTLGGFLRNIAYAVMLVLVIMTALTALGVPTTSMFAILGAAGLAVGLALKDSLSNIASGVMLIVLRPFRAGDAVHIAGQDGVVEQVRIFQTVLRAYQNHDIILPNSLITAEPIINFTAREQRRIDLAIGIGYDDDMAKARSVLLDIAKAHGKVLDDPAAEVLVTGLGESSVDLVLRAWVKTPDYIATQSELTEALRNRFFEAGLSIPYPQRDLHVYHRDADGRPLSELLLRGVADDGDHRPRPPRG